MAEKKELDVVNLVVHSIISAAVGVLGYFANVTMDRFRDLEKRSEETERAYRQSREEDRERAHRLELALRYEMLSKTEFKEWLTYNNRR